MANLTKNSIISVSIGLLLSMVGGVWMLAFQVSEWKFELKTMNERIVGLESRVSNRWTYQMEREAWRDAAKLNPEFNIPPIRNIRDEHQVK